MKNILLNLLSPSDLKTLEPHLKPARFEQHNVLFDADEKINHVYFPTSAVVSLVVTLSTGETIEAAMVGMDGVVGASAALDGKIALSRGIVQLGGEAIVCDIDALKSAAMQSPKPCTPRRSSRRRASLRIGWRQGSRAGCCARGICRAAIICRSRRNISRRCWESAGPASPRSPTPCRRRA